MDLGPSHLMKSQRASCVDLSERDLKNAFEPHYAVEDVLRSISFVSL